LNQKKVFKTQRATRLFDLRFYCRAMSHLLVRQQEIFTPEEFDELTMKLAALREAIEGIENE
jgi:hypothetical protein